MLLRLQRQNGSIIFEYLSSSHKGSVPPCPCQTFTSDTKSPGRPEGKDSSHPVQPLSSHEILLPQHEISKKSRRSSLVRLTSKMISSIHKQSSKIIHPFNKQSNKGIDLWPYYTSTLTPELPTSARHELANLPEYELPGSSICPEMDAQSVHHNIHHRRRMSNHTRPLNEQNNHSFAQYNSKLYPDTHQGVSPTVPPQPPLLQTNMQYTQAHGTRPEYTPSTRSSAFSTIEQGSYAQNSQSTMPTSTQTYITPSLSSETTPDISPISQTSANPGPPIFYGGVHNHVSYQHQFSPSPMHSPSPLHAPMPVFKHHQNNFVANPQLFSPSLTRRNSAEMDTNVIPEYPPRGYFGAETMSPLQLQPGATFVPQIYAPMTVAISNFASTSNNSQIMEHSCQSSPTDHPQRNSVPEIPERIYNDALPVYSPQTAHSVPSNGQASALTITQTCILNDNSRADRGILRRSASAPATINDASTVFPILSCGQCDGSFRGQYAKGNMSRHMRSKHPSSTNGVIEPEDLICRKCKSGFKRPDARKKHEWKQHRIHDVKPKKRGRRRKMPELEDFEILESQY